MRRFLALTKKETLQVLRDPSALIIGFVLPPALLFLFAFAVSLDVDHVQIGVVLESDGPQSRDLAAAFAATRFLEVTPARHRREIEQLLVSGELKGMVVIPADFDRRMMDRSTGAEIQIITDGSSPNSANFVAAYANGVFETWLAGRVGAEKPVVAGIQLEQRFLFNPELESRRVLVPGAMAIVMAVIGTMLTALVVSREWERGTMEAIMSTPASMAEIIFSKLLPYFVLGGLAIIMCTFFAHELYGVPLRGSPWALALIGCAFLVPALGQGLLISSYCRSQFVSAETAMMTGFMPALLLSGFVFGINSMPAVIKMITTIIPARYYVLSLQTVFLAGDVWPLLLANVLYMLAVGIVLFALTFRISRKSLDR